MFDCAVIGTGAAGISAALTLKSLGLNFILLGSGLLSQKIRSAERIENFPAVPSVSGQELSAAFSKQLEGAGIQITERQVTGVYPVSGGFQILTERDVVEAKTVILATGVETVKPLMGETEFLGRGVSYCAVCDGALYRGKTVAVLCTQKESEHEIELLASFAKKVYLVALYRDPEVKAENVELVRGMPVEIRGSMKAEELVFRDNILKVDGIFMLKAAAPPASLVKGLNTEEGHIAVNRAMQTNLAGLFAAGDCTGKPYQYAKAAGEGNVAAHSVFAYLHSV